ncbi:hypothetical protein GWO13_08080 [Candidatus Bathyarchaeota archaeon]|nr:hypothetical protein [Candidatus Bathyarchaeota archaeon]
MKRRFWLALAVAFLSVLAGGVIYSLQNSQNSVFPAPSGGPPIGMSFRVYGLEGDDEANITVTRNGELVRYTYASVDEKHYQHNGAYGISIGCAVDPPEDGVYVLGAYAEGYTVEPESYEVVVTNGRLEGGRQRVYDFLFHRTS